MGVRWHPLSIVTAAGVALVLAGGIALVLAARDPGPLGQAGKAVDRAGETVGDKVKEKMN